MILDLFGLNLALGSLLFYVFSAYLYSAFEMCLTILPDYENMISQKQSWDTEFEKSNLLIYDGGKC